jgi:putative phosphoesterase
MARLALFSDQHGNDVAFKAVVEEIERLGVDEMVCLGDAIQGGTQPTQVLQRLRGLGCRTVLGNADAFVLEVSWDSPEPITERSLEIRDWTLEQLGPADLAQIRSFEPVVEVDLAGMRVVCFHGSPANYDDVLLPEVPDTPLDHYLEALPADLLAGGHTHRQWARQIGDALFINPGSVGVPAGRREPGEPGFRVPLHGEYALVIVDELGLSVEFHQAGYAYADLERAAASSGRPHWQKTLQESAGV